MRNYFKAFTTVKCGVSEGAGYTLKRRVDEQAFFPFEDRSESDTARALQEMIAWGESRKNPQTSIYRSVVRGGVIETYGLPVIGGLVSAGTAASVEG